MGDSKDAQGAKAEAHASPSAAPTRDDGIARVINHDARPDESSLEKQAPTPFGQNDNAPQSAAYHGYADTNNIAFGSSEETPDRERAAEFTEHSFIPAQLAEEQDLEVDESDSDSALGSDTHSTTTSLSESIYNYRKEHGRTYHAYKDGKYIFPNDERESDRLDLQHKLFELTFGDRLFWAPLNDPKRCIDIGTGTGIWAMDFADQFPTCEVTGIDLSPGQPDTVPPNLRFIIDDAEDPWMYDQPFDYIHARLMAGCFADWPHFFQQAYENLEPGGWIEVQDYGLPVKSIDGTADNTDLMRWGELLCEAARILGRPMGSDVSDYYVQWMQEAGFVDIEQKMFMWPTNTWPKDPLMKLLGNWNRVNILEGLEGFCLALLTRALGWQKEEVDIFVAKVSKDLSDKKIHAYFPMPVVFGRKPRADEIASY
ncbi:Hypothetical protein R9X50_00034300 [Acrodontium crateriforme]|uniref:Methyltransferase n=1 Tax=Acrodontium crateriforme TaxID=150365 RepID=A0AAQ3LX32_9PEZI|nr:Hypothetical protein R9X50_00034300 [Acrodontium crateriforme]